ncbi:MAG: molecular chaperone HtpG, partial [Bilophila sp.]
CLVASEEGITSSMDKLMRVLQKDDSIPQKIFEVNREHPLLRTLMRIHKADATDPQLTDMIQNLFDTTLLLDGFLKDPHALASRTNKLLEHAGAWYVDMKKI